MSNTTNTTPAQRAPNQPDERGLEVFNAIRDRCIRLIGEDRFMREASFVMQAVAADPKLGACTRPSVIAAMLNIANTGLTANPIRKEAFLVPRNVKLRTAEGNETWEKRLFIEPSYVGLMKLATDTGSVKHFEAQVVWAGDEFQYDLTEKKPKVHTPYWVKGNERGELRGVYGYATLADGSVVPEHMGSDELALIRSKSDNANGSVYKDWQGEMARKALLKRLQKYVPRTEKSEQFLQAVELDNQQFDLEANAENRATRQLQERVRQALDFYQGEDKEELRAMCREKALAGEFTEPFARNVLDRLGEKTTD